MRYVDTTNVKRMLRKGHGTGSGSDYLPWLTVRSPSTGTSSIVTGRLVGRGHHVLSRLERGTFLILQKGADLVDIREQYPLLPLSKTQAIAEEIGVRHPRVLKKGDAPMTTDFLVERKSGLHAYAVKHRRDLASKRTREKLLIEELFWAAASVPWSLVTDAEIDRTVADNLVMLDNEWRPPSHLAEPTKMAQLTRTLRKLLEPRVRRPLSAVCLDTDARLGLPEGVAIRGILHLVSRSILQMDLGTLFCPAFTYEIIGRELINCGRR